MNISRCFGRGESTRCKDAPLTEVRDRLAKRRLGGARARRGPPPVLYVYHDMLPPPMTPPPTKRRHTRPTAHTASTADTPRHHLEGGRPLYGRAGPTQSAYAHHDLRARPLTPSCTQLSTSTPLDDDGKFTPTKHPTPPPHTHHSSRPAAAHTGNETLLQ